MSDQKTRLGRKVGEAFLEAEAEPEVRSAPASISRIASVGRCAPRVHLLMHLSRDLAEILRRYGWRDA